MRSGSPCAQGELAAKLTEGIDQIRKEQTMEQIITLLQELGTWLDRISVSGESVDYLAMARQTWRTACREAQQQESTKGDANG